MHIGIDISKALGRTDGIGRTTAELVRAQLALDRDDPEVRDNRFTLYPVFEPATRERFAERVPDAPESFRFTTARRPAPGEVEVFHVTTHSVPEGIDCPLVVTLYDLSFLTHPQLHTLANRLHCLRGTARALARGARPIAISEHTRRDAAHLLALPEQAIEVIYPAAGPGFRPVPAEEAAAVAARYGLDGPYVLTVGTLEPRKHLPALLAAWRMLPEAVRAGHRLAVAGPSGWLAGAPEALIGPAGEPGAGESDAAGGRVLLLGEVPDADLPALYSGAAAFVYPSLYEGFGLPPLEAMACGAPVVASRAASLPEVVGDAAMLVDPHDPGSIRDGLASVLTDRAWAAALREAGPRQAALYSWERAARQTLAVYRRAAAESHRSSGG
jgi:glycosyltransferase involved in cell wall biosynthesis